MEKAWQVVLAFVGIFAAGAVTGSLLTMRVIKEVAPHRAGPGNGNAGNGAVVEQFAPAQLRMLAQQLDLTKEQRETIGPIVRRTGDALSHLRQDTQRDTRILLERMNDGITAVLTPEQLVKYEEIRERQRLRMLQQMQERKNRPGQDRPGQGPAAGRPNANPAPDARKGDDPRPPGTP